MRLAGFFLLAAVAGALADGANALPAAAASPRSCAIPVTGQPQVVFSSRYYRTYTLFGGYIRPTRLVGYGRPWVCQDTVDCAVGPPLVCRPEPPTPPATIRLWAIRGISPRLALSRGGSSRELVVASGACAKHLERERRLLRCLRALS